MGILNVLQSGKSGMSTAKAGIATAGHNIANTNTEGFSRQRVQSEANVSKQMAGSGGPYVGEGSKITRIERINDEYLEKQLREGQRDLSYHEEKQVFLGQIEDTFNEMNGDGINRVVARFFNDFRKLSNDPSSEAIRQSLRESSQAMVNDFRRIRKETEGVSSHIDTRIDGYMSELNSYAKDLGELNVRISHAENTKTDAPDLEDRRDVVLKKMSALVDITIHKDNNNMVNVDIKNVGPLVTGPNTTLLSLGRAPAQLDGSPENSLQASRSPFGNQYVTTSMQGGKLGALVETRDKAVSMVLNRLDQMAHSIVSSVNEIHQKGFTQDGRTNVDFFKPMDSVARAAETLSLSDDIKNSHSNIALALQPDAPGDNRNALAIANLQNSHLMNNGNSTIDDYYNSIISDVGVASSRNSEAMGQQRSILTQLNKVRDQVSGVSIDEETTNLMQFQHAFDASARVIKVADEMLDTVLKLKS